MKTIPAPKAGDPCPNCGGEFFEHRAPTDEERAAATDRENPRALPPRVDTATKDQREELGALHECRECHYKTRIPPVAETATAEGGEDAGADAARAENGGQRRGDARRRVS